jgi:hypothetical protein
MDDPKLMGHLVNVSRFIENVIIHSDICPLEGTIISLFLINYYFIEMVRYCKSDPSYRLTKRTMMKDECNKNIGVS